MAVSIERALIALAKAEISITNLCAGRIYNILPPHAVMPCLTIRRVGGGFADGEAPIDVALVQVDAYSFKADRNAPTKRITADFAGAENLLLAFIDWAHAAPETAVGTDWIYGMEIAGIRRVTEEDTEWARYAADVFVTARDIP